MPRDTSIRAYVSISHEEVSRLQAQILEVLEDGPKTDEEIAREFDGTTSMSSLRTRRAELVSLGRVHDTGQRRASGAGRTMTVWGLRVAASGMRPNAMPGRPDRYVDIDRARAQAQDNERAVQDAAQRDLLRQTPYREGPLRPVFGDRICSTCEGSGGNRLDGACWRCAGTGIVR